MVFKLYRYKLLQFGLDAVLRLTRQDAAKAQTILSTQNLHRYVILHTLNQVN